MERYYTKLTQPASINTQFEYGLAHAFQVLLNASPEQKTFDTALDIVRKHHDLGLELDILRHVKWPKKPSVISSVEQRFSQWLDAKDFEKPFRIPSLPILETLMEDRFSMSRDEWQRLYDITSSSEEHTSSVIAHLSPYVLKPRNYTNLALSTELRLAMHKDASIPEDHFLLFTKFAPTLAESFDSLPAISNLSDEEREELTKYAYMHLPQDIADSIFKKHQLDPDERFRAFLSITKDLTIIERYIASDAILYGIQSGIISSVEQVASPATRPSRRL